MGIIRFLLAISVIAVHVGPIFGLKLVPGPIAVQSFFIISGFYISLILNEKYIGANKSYLLFITNRFLRIYPVYLSILLISILTYIFFFIVSDHKVFPVFTEYQTIKDSLTTCFMVTFSNLFIWGQDLIMFLGFHHETGKLFFTTSFWSTKPMLWTLLFIPPAWSIAIELTFYVFAPLLLKKGAGIVLIGMFLSILVRFYIYYYLRLTSDPWTYRFFPAELLFFLSGYFSYCIYVRVKKHGVPRLYNHCILIINLLFTLNYSSIQSASTILFQFYWNDLLYLFMIFFSIPFLFNYLKDSQIDRFIGDLSYPIYLSHWFVSTVIWLSPYNCLKNSWSVAGIACIFSIFLNLFISARVEKYRQKRIQ